MQLFIRRLSLIAFTALILTSCTKDDFIENEVPVADAGSSKAITLPVNSETLSGSGTDKDGKVVAYLWSQVSGPSATTIVNPGSASTLIKGFVEGSYVFQLMVTDDKGATGVDTTTVVVSPAPQQTVTLAPSNNLFDYKLQNWNGQDESQNNSPDIAIHTWTKNGLPYKARGLLKFDLSSIPANASIISANLYLFSYPPPTLNGNLVDANSGTDNSFVVQKVTSDWASPGTTWFNQPASTTTNQVIIPSTSQQQLDLNLDVKNIVSSMVAENNNYGFLLKLQNEVAYTCRIFVSSHNTTYPDKRPKLVIVYK
jgi:hypothetical protein